MPIPGFLKNIFAGGAGELVKEIKNLVDESKFSAEEKAAFEEKMLEVTNAHLEKMVSLAQAETDAFLKDSENARNREIQIASAEKAPLINKIITPVIALVVVVATLTIWALILFRHYEPKINEAIIIGSLTTVCSGVVNYYFGSSQGSANKQKQLDSMMNR